MKGWAARFPILLHMPACACNSYKYSSQTSNRGVNTWQMSQLQPMDISGLPEKEGYSLRSWYYTEVVLKCAR